MPPTLKFKLLSPTLLQLNKSHTGTGQCSTVIGARRLVTSCSSWHSFACHFKPVTRFNRITQNTCVQDLYLTMFTLFSVIPQLLCICSKYLLAKNSKDPGQETEWRPDIDVGCLWTPDQNHSKYGLRGGRDQMSSTMICSLKDLGGHPHLTLETILELRQGLQCPPPRYDHLMLFNQISLIDNLVIWLVLVRSIITLIEEVQGAAVAQEVERVIH